MLEWVVFTPDLSPAIPANPVQNGGHGTSTGTPSPQCSERMSAPAIHHSLQQGTT